MRLLFPSAKETGSSVSAGWSSSRFDLAHPGMPGGDGVGELKEAWRFEQCRRICLATSRRLASGGGMAASKGAKIVFVVVYFFLLYGELNKPGFT